MLATDNYNTMKMRFLLPAIYLTLFTAVGIQAQSTYTPGDAFLFFAAQSGTGSSKNVQIDLGDLSSSSFSSFNFSTNALAAVLGATYGSSWFSSNVVSWGLIGSPQVNAVDLTGFGLTIGTTGANTGQALDFSSVATIGSALDPMYQAGTNAGSVESTILDSLGNSHYYSIYNTANQSSASANDANGFGFFPGTLSGSITSFTNNNIVAYATADDGSGTGIISSQLTTGTFSITSGVISILAYVAPSGGTNVWATNAGNLSTIGITNSQNLVFAGGGGSVTNNAQVTSLSGITFSNTASASYTLSGSNIAIGASGIVNNSTNTQTVSTPVTLSASQTFNAASGNLVVSGAITNGGNLLTVAGANNTTLSGAISGLGGLTMAGTGTTTLSAVSTFSGNTLVSSGTLLIAGYGNTNSAVTVGSSSVLNGINAGGPATLGAVTVTNGGSLALSNAVTDGTLYVKSLSLASNSLSSFDIKSTNNYSSLNASGNIALGGALTLAIQGLYNSTNNQGLFQVYSSGGAISGNFSSVTLSGSYTGNLAYYSNNNTWQLWSGTGTNAFYAGINLNSGLVTVIPEPSSYALFALGTIACLAFGIRRKIIRD
ncbi:MAG: PEP-CTERM sorting domain-containing protein [bacterium]